MKILIINAGSSSLKYQLIDMTNEDVLAKGNCDRIGLDGVISHKLNDGRILEEKCQFNDHSDAFTKIVDVLINGEYAIIDNLSEIGAVGHRVVQGAEFFSQSVFATDDVIQKIDDIKELAPLHNPGHIQALKACKKVFGNDIHQVAVFDTAFHQSMPKKAFIYGIPYEYYEKYHIRKYGFHGTSHRFVSKRLAKRMGKDIEDLKIVTCHLGNGSSIAAISNGKCIDTSMGFTPLDGLIMGTRCGNIDPSVLLYIMEKEGLSPSEMNMMLNKKSGYLGISGITSDDRDLRKAAAEGNKRAELAGDIQRYQIKKYIGSYAAAMGGLDAVIFTGGIGENSAPLREKVCRHMQFLGIELDTDKNIICNSQEMEISMPYSKVKVWIIPTNEELLIARDTKNLVNSIK